MLQNPFIFLCSLCLLTLIACTNRQVESIVVRGSDTEVNLVLLLAEQFMEQHTDVSIAVTGGGSGTGIAALINQKTNVANSSRPFKSAELSLAEERGIQVVPIIFAMDALCFIVSDKLSIDSLSVPELEQIFKGKTKNWKALGGPDQTIALYGRQANSGTYAYIQSQILKGDYDVGMNQMNGTAQIIEAIKNDATGIGYVGIGYVADQNGLKVEGIKVLSLKADDASLAISPLNFNKIQAGAYPIVRPLYQYLDGKPNGKLKAFIEFELSELGQEIIQENGYFGLPPHYAIQNQNQLYN